MLQNIRANVQGTFAKIVIGLIVVSFAIFGIESILLGGGGSGIAEVNGEQLSPAEVQQTINLQKRQLLSMLGDDADPALLDDDRLAAQAIDTLIERRVQVQAAKAMGLAVSDQTLGGIIGGMEQFQMDGKFSPELFQSLLSGAGYTPALFQQSLREDILLTQLRAGLAASDFATPAELSLNATITEEQRDVRYITLPIDAFNVAESISDADIVAFYEQNPQQFLSREEVALSYLELTTDDFMAPVSEGRLREEFDLTRSEYQYQTENRVAHILFERSEDESDEAFAARIAAAQTALEAGEDFAEVARRASDDIGSAAAGGDLGFSAGGAFPDAMEEAIASLETGEVSAAVQTEAGTHLIKLLERREGEAISLDDVRAELSDSIARADARATLILAVEELRDLVFNAEDLRQPAAKLSLTVQQAEQVLRGEQTGLFAAASLQSAIFSEDVLEVRHNSDVVELSPDRYVVVHVDDYRPPAVRPLAEVRAEIAGQIASLRAREMAESTARGLVAQLVAGSSVEDAANAQGYAWQVELGATRAENALPQAVTQRLFALPAPAGGPVRDIVTAEDDAVYVLEVARVNPGNIDALQQQRLRDLRRGIAGEFGGLVQQQYESAQRAAADITVY